MQNTRLSHLWLQGCISSNMRVVQRHFNHASKPIPVGGLTTCQEVTDRNKANSLNHRRYFATVLFTLSMMFGGGVQAQEVSEPFRRLDRNKDGKLTKDEFSGVLFDRIDRNKRFVRGHGSLICFAFSPIGIVVSVLDSSSSATFPKVRVCLTIECCPRF